MPTLARRGHQIPGSGSFQQVLSCHIWVLKCKPGFSKIASALSSAPHMLCTVVRVAVVDITPEPLAIIPPEYGLQG